MRRIVLGLAVLLVCVAAFAQQPLNVWFKLPSTIPSNGMVSGTTNLPDGTLLSLSLAGPSGSQFNRENCCYDAVVAVSHGAFGPVMITHAPAPPGAYKILIVMRDWMLQPPNVVAVIGKNGANLTGPYLNPAKTFFDNGIQASIPVSVRDANMGWPH